MTPTVSVVIPTFNRSALLINAIESVLRQTYKDYEVIVIDDGSTDDTAERLKPYMNRIRYVYQDNRGASAARNKGIEVARGQWISPLDSDDVWLPMKLERQLTALNTLGNEFGACFTEYTCVGNWKLKPSAFEQAGLKTRSDFGPLDDPVNYVLKRYAAICVPSLLVLRSLLQELNGFDEAMVVGEDLDLLFRLTFRTRFCFVSAPLVKVDRTPSRPRLTDLASHRNDQLYSCIEYRHRKWLRIPELVDLGTRQTIHDNLRLLYYDWAVAMLYQLRVTSAFRKINEIKAMGNSYVMILFALLARAVKKLNSSLNGWRAT